MGAFYFKHKTKRSMKKVIVICTLQQATTTGWHTAGVLAPYESLTFEASGIKNEFENESKAIEFIESWLLFGEYYLVLKYTKN